MQALQGLLLDGHSTSVIKVFPALPAAWEQNGASFS